MLATEPEFIDLTPEMKTRLDHYRDEHKDDPIGNVGGRIILEDERIRIWELNLAPGEARTIRRARPLRWWLLGRARSTPQPATGLPDGTTVSLY